jgi:hypothetical protein
MTDMSRFSERELPEPYCYWSSPPDSGPRGNGTVVSRKRGSPITKEQIMQAFDRLPWVVREALASANQPWAPTWASDAVWKARMWGLPPAAIVERIERADRDEAQRRELQLLARKG